MDRFRVFSQVKLLSSPLPPSLFEVTRAVCLEKLAILRNGAERRGRVRSVRAYDRWIHGVESSDVCTGQAIDATRGFPSLLTAVGVSWDRRDEDPILSALLPLTEGDDRGPLEE